MASTLSRDHLLGALGNLEGRRGQTLESRAFTAEAIRLGRQQILIEIVRRGDSFNDLSFGERYKREMKGRLLAYSSPTGYSYDLDTARLSGPKLKSFKGSKKAKYSGTFQTDNKFLKYFGYLCSVVVVSGFLYAGYELYKVLDKHLNEDSPTIVDSIFPE